MSEHKLTEEQIDDLGNAPKAELAKDKLHDDESRQYLRDLNKQQSWTLFQSKASFWSLIIFAVLSMVTMYVFTGFVLADQDASLSDWGAAALIAGTIAQSAFLMRATVPKIPSKRRSSS